jgi:hypothetical protein
VAVGNAADISEVHAVSMFHPEDGASMYLQNSGNIAHNPMVQQPKNNINIHNYN